MSKVGATDVGPGVRPEGGFVGLGLEVATETRTQRGDGLPGSKRASEGSHLGIPGAVADQVPSLCLGRFWVLIQLLLWMDILAIVLDIVEILKMMNCEYAYSMHMTSY